jgi:DNA modification methylase
VKPYYEDIEAGIRIFHGDCRDILPTFPDKSFIVLTDPPYPNGEGYFEDSILAARELFVWLRVECLTFWSEMEKPRLSVPHVATHIWHRNNVNGKIYEPIYHFHPDGRKRRSDLFSAPVPFNGVGAGCIEYAGHPTQKHSAVMRWLIQKTEGGIVDPFMGSGTTLVAAKQLGRKAVGIEIEKKYCEIAVKRLAQMEMKFQQLTTGGNP